MAGTSARAELVTNGTFASGTTGWSVVGATANATSGAAVVSSRTGIDKGLGQLLSITPAMKGLSYRASCSVKTTSPTAVRMILSYTDGGTPVRRILAERVIRQTTAFEFVSDSFVLDWQSSITSPILLFEIGHRTRDVQSLPGGGLFPDVTIDDVSIDDDTDRDGLTDAEELVYGTLGTTRDHDGDGLPDGWEKANGTDAFVYSANGDPDFDGFTNTEEYWAATNPQDGTKFPGDPCDPMASDEVKAVLRYMALLPSKGATNRLLAGQHLTTMPADFNSQVAPFGSSPYSDYPAIMSVSYDNSAAPPDPTPSHTYLVANWNAGGLVAVDWHPRHPWTQGLYSYCATPNQTPCQTPDPVDIADMLSDGSPTGAAARAFLDDEMDIVGAGLANLQTAGVVVIFRPMVEMNGGHFWWGARGRQEFIDLYSYMRTYLITNWGLHNIIWAQSAQDAPHAAIPADYYYPGDDVVDVIGYNWYDGDFSTPYSFDAIFRRYPKVCGNSEVGPENTPSSRDGSFSNMTYLDGVNLVSGIRNEFPRASFFIPWNSFTNVTLHHIAIVDNLQGPTLLADPWIVTRGDVPSALWLAPTSGDAGWMLQ